MWSAQPAARSARPAHPPGGRPVCAGHVRRHRRPGPQEADAGHLRPGQPRSAAAGLLAGRLRPQGLGATRTSPRSPTRRSRSTPYARSATRSGSSSARASVSSQARSTTTRRSTGWPRPLEKLDAERGTGGNYAFYLAIPPKSVSHRGASSCKRSPGLARLRTRHAAGGRVVIEKPFGHDLDSARELNDDPERGLPRRSRCSASTTTSARRRSRTSWRCASPTQLYEPIWNRDYVDHVQITDGRGHRHRRPRRLLRRRSAPPATSSRTTCCSCSR